ncbi:MAG: Hsp20/alpha crystallin family protein [Candidatus Bathyarchaeota archaeon]|nr:Hsp20/alpha crystallin family protein [Candidatus Bathyarchaeota archaeon]
MEGKNTSARWRRTNKNKDWLNFNTSTKAGVKKSSSKPPANHQKILSPPNFRPPKSYAKRKWEEPSPLIDIFQEKNSIIIVAEIAGFNKDTLKINVKNQKLTLSAKTKERRYYKSLNLPKVVIPSAVHTTYKNGVLEIKLKKAQAPEAINKQAD